MYSRNRTKSRTKKLFRSDTTAVSNDGNVDRGSLTNGATRARVVVWSIGASTATKFGTRASPSIELSQAAWRDSTDARPAATGTYCSARVLVSSAPWPPGARTPGPGRARRGRRRPRRGRGGTAGGGPGGGLVRGAVRGGVGLHLGSPLVGTSGGGGARRRPAAR